jgi:4-amino-4-deoxy-L-arabinose transferase-like glycosyltransferase
MPDDPTKNVDDIRHLLAILGIALLARFLWAALVPVIPVSDPYAYHTFALNLVHHGVYGWNANEPTAIWPLGTSAAYALIYSVFGSGQWAIKCFNLATGILIVFLTVELGTRWFNRRVAIIAGLLVGLWPVLIEYTTIIGSEMLFTAALLGVLLLFDKICSNQAHFKLLAVTLGSLMGFASLLRPPALLLPGLLALVFFVQRRKIISSLKLFAITTVVMLIVVMPWSVRNYALFGEFVAISTSGGGNLWMGNNPMTTGFYQEGPTFDVGMNEAQKDRILRNEAVTYIKQAPMAFATRTVVKAFRLYERETIGVWWNSQGIERKVGSLGGTTIKVASQAFWMGVLLLFGIGCYLSSRLRLASFACHPDIATLAYFTLIYATFVIQDRYHIPTNPIMAIFAAYAILQMVPVARPRFWPFGPMPPGQGVITCNVAQVQGR